MNAAPYEVPVIVETTFSVSAGGEAGPSRLSDLINKYKLPMWVDEIRISSPNTESHNFFTIFTQTSTRILFGRYPITREFIPTSVLAPRWPGNGHVIMRLHKPLYVTPQNLPVPTIRSEVSIAIRFSLIGRLAKPLPTNAKSWIPYVTAFSGTSVAMGDVSNQQSNRNDLANPFRTPLNVRFFLGYRTAYGSNVLAGSANSDPPITLRMSNHLGRPIVRDPTPFYDLFNIRDQAWAVNTTVPQGGYFLANVAVNATDAVETQKFDLGMFGYREEPIQWGT